MAKQDFAQVGSSNKSASASDAGSIVSVIAIVVIAGLCFSGGFWLGSAGTEGQTAGTAVHAVQGKLAAQEAENRILQAKNERLEEMVAQWKSKAEAGAHEKVGDLTFYKELPKQQVLPAPVAEIPDSPVAQTAPVESIPSVKHVAVARQDDAPGNATAHSDRTETASDGHFRIQLASFRMHADATTMHNRLATAGFPSQIQKVDLGERGEWFRIYAGPYASKSEAERARPQLESRLKLKGLLIRER